ncbi:MAG: hypothetical protein J6C19_05020 [Lachnospiraceae bacterium]|nr:hypothetical protein [Lachnospiraceae bacterium]
MKAQEIIEFILDNYGFDTFLEFAWKLTVMDSGAEAEIHTGSRGKEKLHEV